MSDKANPEKKASTEQPAKSSETKPTDELLQASPEGAVELSEEELGHVSGGIKIRYPSK